MEVEDAKRLVRDAIAARIFNDMVSLERKSSNETSSPFPPPYAKLKLEKNYVVYGWGREGLGMYDYEESPTSASVTKDSWP